MTKRLLLLTVLSLPAFADECMLTSKDLVPQFSAKLPKGFKVTTKKGKSAITQTLKTPDGYEVGMRFEGCSHVHYEYSIRGAGITTKTVGAELVAVSKRVLGALPMVQDPTADPKLLIRALDEARIATLPADLPCGDAECQLALIPDEPKKDAKKKAPAKKDEKAKDPKEDETGTPARLVLSYDMAI